MVRSHPFQWENQAKSSMAYSGQQFSTVTWLKQWLFFISALVRRLSFVSHNSLVDKLMAYGLDAWTLRWIYLAELLGSKHYDQWLEFQTEAGSSKVYPRGQSWDQILLDIFTNDLDDGIMFWCTLGKLEDKSKNRRYQCLIDHNWGQQSPGLHSDCCQHTEGSDPSPLFCIGEATFGVVGSVLGSPVQQRCGCVLQYSVDSG